MTTGGVRATGGRMFHVKHIHKFIHKGGRNAVSCGQNAEDQARLESPRSPHPRRTVGRLALMLAALSLLLAGCGSVAEAAGWSAPIVLPDGSVLIQTKPGEVRAIDPSSGSERWHFPNSVKTENASKRVSKPVKGTFYAAPVLDRDRVYLVSYDGHLVRLDRTRNDLANPWTVELRESVVATPVLNGGRLFVATEAGEVLVVNTEDGAIVGRHRTSDGRVWGSPLIAADLLIVPNFDAKKTHALRLADGQPAWITEATGGSIASVVSSGPNVLVGSLDGALYALDAATGERRWTFSGDGWMAGAPLVAGDTIYAPSMGGSVYALSLDGQQRWQFSLDAEKPELRATPVLVNGVLVAAARRGVVVGLDPATGQQRWRTPIADVRLDANPMVIDGSVYLMTTKHALFRVDAATGAQQQISVPRD